MTHGGEPRQRIDRPWRLTLLAAVVAAIVATVVLPHHPRGTSYTFGSHVGALLVPSMLAALVVRQLTWPRWAAVLATTVVFALGLVLLQEVGPRIRDAREAGQARFEGSNGTGDVTVRAPDRIGQWRRQQGPGARRLDLAARHRLDALPDGYMAGTPAVGVYRSGAGTVAFAAYAVGGLLADSVASDPRQGAVDYVGGATGDDHPERVDPGPLGGGVACTDEIEEAVAVGAIVCAWADAGTVGQLTLVVRDLSVEDAGPLVQLFRKAATSVDAG